MRRFVLLLACLFSATSYSQQGSSSVEGLYEKVMAIDELIRNNLDKQTHTFDPSDHPTLPVGIVKRIDSTEYIICVDSAYFTPEGAFFNVYMALNFPYAEKRIAFAATGIQFNPQGVSLAGGAKLMLVNEQKVKINPKMQLVFKDDGQNFIEFDCNGYRQAGLSLDLVLDSTSFVNAIDPAASVKASMQVAVADINNISFQLSELTPFRLKNTEDLTFHLQNIVIDQSDLVTPSSVHLDAQSLQLYPGGIEQWRGLYAGQVNITLPKKLSEGDEGDPPTSIYANHFIIDDSGLSGSVGVNNLFSVSSGKMEGNWGFSIDNLQLDVAHNNIVGGAVSGDIQIPVFDDNVFGYSASISQNPNHQKLDYSFTVSTTSDIRLNCFKSVLTLSPNSQLTVQTEGDRFLPSATLHGSWTVDFEKAKINGITFQNVKIVTEAPYITQGTFDLVSNSEGTNMIKFPISIDNLGMSFTVGGQLSFNADVGLSLGGENINFGVNTTLHIITAREGSSGGNERLVFDRMAIDDIGFQLATGPFDLSGVISVKNDDPVFGDLFYGSISLKLSGIMDNPIMVSAGFGKLPEFKYWFTDASVPVNIPVVPGLSITSLYGGVQRRVSSTLSNDELLDRVIGQIVTTPGNMIPFVPDASQGLTFRAGVAIQNTVEKVFNGEVLLSVSFNANGGFQSINFLGRAFMMVTRDQRGNENAKKVAGQLSVNYDNANKVFDAGLSAQIVFPGFLTGGLSIALHIDQHDWYFWLNNPIDRAYLNLVDIFEVNTYFMIGTEIMPIPPPPSYVTDVVGAGSINTIDLNAVGNGSGFATGMQFGVGFGGEFPKSGNWRGYVTLNVGGGFDIMLINVSNAHCSGSSDPVGINSYYLMGQVYAYLDGSLGARKYKNGTLKKQWSVGSLQVAALLQGKLPKPTFVYGAVGVNVEIMDVIKFSFTADVEFGTDCALVGL